MEEFDYLQPRLDDQIAWYMGRRGGSARVVRRARAPLLAGLNGKVEARELSSDQMVGR